MFYDDPYRQQLGYPPMLEHLDFSTLKRPTKGWKNTMSETKQYDKDDAVGRIMLKMVGSENLLFSGMVFANISDELRGGSLIIKKAAEGKKIDAQGVIIVPGYKREDARGLAGYIQLMRNTNAEKKYSMLAYIKLQTELNDDKSLTWITTHKAFIYRIGDTPTYEGDVLPFTPQSGGDGSTPALGGGQRLW